MILIKNCSILPMTSQDDFIDNGYLVVEGSDITAVNPGICANEGRFETVIDAVGGVADQQSITPASFGSSAQTIDASSEKSSGRLGSMR